MVWTRRVHVNLRRLRQGKELIELRQALGTQDAGVGVEGMIGQEHADAIDTQRFHVRKIFARGLRVELFPHLRRPAGPRPIIIHAERDKRLTLPCDECAPVVSDADFGQWPRRRGARGRRGARWVIVMAFARGERDASRHRQDQVKAFAIHIASPGSKLFPKRSRAQVGPGAGCTSIKRLP
jgi:hypothetical protein